MAIDERRRNIQSPTYGPHFIFKKIAEGFHKLQSSFSGRPPTL